MATTYTRTLKLSTHNSVTFTYEVSETATDWTVKLTTVKFANSTSGGVSTSYWQLGWHVLTGSGGTELDVAYAQSLSAGTKAKTWTRNKSRKVAKTHAAQSLSVSFDVGMRHMLPMSNGSYAVTDSYSKDATYTHTIPAKASYAVTYDANGASGTTTAQTKWHNEALPLRAALTRSGWTWVGWGTSATATTAAYKAGASYTANAALKLYAITKRTLTLSYSANGGSGAPSAQSATVYNKTTSSTFKVASGAPARAGYRFRGWATSAARANVGTIDQAAGSSKTLSANATLYAVWSAVEPTLSVGRAYRADSHGNPNSMGTYLAVEAAYSLSSAAGSHSWGVTVTDGSAAVTASAAETDAGGVATFLVDAGLVATTRYAVAVTLTDDLGTVLRSDSVTMAAEVPSAAPPISLASGGLGVTIGAQAVLQTGFDVRMEQFAYGSRDHPLFVWSSAPTASDTFPYSPCLVYVPTENALYFCTND